jgi:hypothetical protein
MVVAFSPVIFKEASMQNGKTKLLSSRFTIRDVEASLERLSFVGQYAATMEMLSVCNAAKDTDFQKRYAEFYKLKRDSKRFRSQYFLFMENNKGNTALDFEKILTHLRRVDDTLEASFSAKLLHTLKPNFPTWDQWIGKYTRIKIPASGVKDRFGAAVERYDRLTAWFNDYSSSKEGKQALRLFDEYFPCYKTRITAVKKIDFILWRMR